MTRNMNKWNAVRRYVLIEGNSKRSACDKYNIGWSVLKKMLKYSEPQPYKERKTPSRSKAMEPFQAALERMLEEDATAPVKQRHSAKRIFDRLLLAVILRGDGEYDVKSTLRPVPELQNTSSHVQSQTYLSPTFQPPSAGLRRFARQHGRIGVQGIHLRHAFSEAGQRPV